MNPDDRLSLLALSHALFLSPRERMLLIEMRGGAGNVLTLDRRELSLLVGRGVRAASWEPARLLAAGARSEKRLTAGSIGCIFYSDRGYPPQLRDIYDPPGILFFRGKPPDSGVPLFAVVGTRLPTGAGRRAAFALGFELASAGAGVVSGLARGIDREAHEGCVAAGGWTAAVLGCGIDRISPASSRGTAARILDAGGILLSEYPPGTPPMSQHFPARNRIISGLSRGVVVVQAPEESGALITAEFALEHGRDLVVHRAGLAGPTGAGTRGLADSGAPVIDGAAGVLAECGLLGPVTAGLRAPPRRQPVPAGRGSTDGPGIARIVADEISGLCVRRGGETFWRG